LKKSQNGVLTIRIPLKSVDDQRDVRKITLDLQRRSSKPVESRLSDTSLMFTVYIDIPLDLEYWREFSKTYGCSDIHFTPTVDILRLLFP
jgi:hypothetical protein